jgi:hypothetical protein
MLGPDEGHRVPLGQASAVPPGRMAEMLGLIHGTAVQEVS